MKKFIRLTAVLTAVIMTMAVLCSCSEDKAARANLTKMFDLLKKGDYTEAVSEYIGGDSSDTDFIHCGGKFDKDSFAAYDMHMAVFDSLEYNIKKTKSVSETEIHFTTEITTIDLSPVGDELAETTAAFNISSANAEAEEKLSDEELNNILSQQMVSISNDYLSDGNAKKRTVTVEIKMYYDRGGNWVVYLDRDLANALNGGVYDAFYSALESKNIMEKK